MLTLSRVIAVSRATVLMADHARPAREKLKAGLLKPKVGPTADAAEPAQ